MSFIRERGGKGIVSWIAGCCNERMKCRLFLVAFAALTWLGGVGLMAQDAGRSLYVEGYPGRVSYAPGDELEFHLSTTAEKIESLYEALMH